jgi:hypothetical protein
MISCVLLFIDTQDDLTDMVVAIVNLPVTIGRLDDWRDDQGDHWLRC